MFDTGIARMRAAMTNAEEKGRAISNPYGQALLREYIEPLAKSLTDMIGVDKKHSGKYASSCDLVGKLDPFVVMYLALRSVVNALTNHDPVPVRR